MKKPDKNKMGRIGNLAEAGREMAVCQRVRCTGKGMAGV